MNDYLSGKMSEFFCPLNVGSYARTDGQHENSILAPHGGEGGGITYQGN